MPLDSDDDPAGNSLPAGSSSPRPLLASTADLLILGASARAAAYSAIRAGLRPVCADLFADRDLTAVCPTRQIDRHEYPDGLLRAAGSAPTAPWLYTGALENEPELIDAVSRQRPLWGNAGSIVRAVRDPVAVADVLRRADLPVPKVRLDPNGLPRDNTWMVKPFRSGGGRGVHPLGPAAEAPAEPCYYQERIGGPSLAAVFIASRHAAELAGVTRQWMGRPGAPFTYCGSIGPWPVPPAVTRRLEILGGVVASFFGLTGLFGIDFILRKGVPWPVEVNPRYTASVEVLELAQGRSLLASHRAAYVPTVNGVLAGQPDRPAAQHAVVAKLIVFASRRCAFPDDHTCNAATPDPFALADVHDIPQPGTCFEEGEPVITLLAAGSVAASCRARLLRERTRWLRVLRRLDRSS